MSFARMRLGDVMKKEATHTRRSHQYTPGSDDRRWSQRDPRSARRAIAPESPGAKRCRRKFLRFFPDGFRDKTYLAWERDYKWNAHLRWQEVLNPSAWQRLLKQRKYVEAAAHAVRIESRTNLLFSFEK